LLTGLIDGFSPLITTILIIFPFFILPQPTCFFTSISISFITLFFLGVCLGKISKKSIILSGLQMVSAGILAVAILILLKAF